MKRKLKAKEKKENNTRLLKKKLDTVFSKWIRNRDSQIFDGKSICCPCCGVLIPVEKSQCMHYNSRAKMNTRYDERNCYAGCVRCNVILNGNYPAFTEHLLIYFGQDWLRRLISDGNKIKQWTAPELKELIKKYSCV